MAGDSVTERLTAPRRRHQAADFWVRPFSAKRAASSRSAVVKWQPRSCNWATKRTRNMPRFSIGKPAAAAQIVRSCESEKRAWRHGLAGAMDVNFSQWVRRTRAAGIHNEVTICALKPLREGETGHAHFWIPRRQLSDRLVFCASADRDGRHSACCSARHNPIIASADSR